MDFDLDDPMESDDSFFEEPKVLNKRASLTKTAEKKSLESIFGLGDKSEKIELDKPKSTVTFNEPTATTKTDVIKLSETNPTATYEKPNKKTDFLEDILPIHPKPTKLDKKTISFDDILKDSKASATSVKSSPAKHITSPAEPTSDLNLMAMSRERRRTRRGSAAMEDALGLFGDDFQSGDYYSKDKIDKNVKKTDDNVGKTRTISDKGVPDWLGLNQPDTSYVNKTETEAQKPLPQSSDQVDGPKQPQVVSKAAKADGDVPSQLNPERINTDIQNTYTSLHTQESLLLVSLQLKKYEESLTEIKNQQQEMLGRQEKQFNTLIDGYISKQQMVENNIRLQQERINNQIQMLLSNPVSRTTSATDGEHNEEQKDDFEETRSLIKSIRQRHDEEMFIMEESYKKQINHLESSNATLEEKLREEMSNMANTFEEKINSFKTKCDEDVSYYRDKLRALEEQHQNEIKLMKENHARLIEELKTEHATQVDYIKRMKQHEEELLSDGRMFSQKLDTNIETLHASTKVLQSMEERVSQSYDVLTIARENSIQSKEKEIILMRNSLEKCREAAETERSQLLALVRNLEVKLAEQTHNAKEDRWALQQAAATLTARAAAMEREAEYNRNVIEREREQLKTLKESLLTEQENMVMKLTEEKLQLSAEKARHDASTKLTHSYETERIKTEAETAIQVAKDLTEKVTQERNQLMRYKSELDALKRDLAEREREMEEKEVELEFLMQDAQRKLREDKKVLMDARKMENIYKERLEELQNQWITLSCREKKVAEEKVSLSKERLALYSTMKTAKGCVLCKADEKINYQKSKPINNEEIIQKVSDVDVLRLRIDAYEDESEVSKEDNVTSVNR